MKGFSRLLFSRLLAMLWIGGAAPLALWAEAMTEALERHVTVLSLSSMATQRCAIVDVLQKIEEQTGGAVQDMFDLIVGVSSGGVIAYALAHPSHPTPGLLREKWELFMQKCCYAPWSHAIFSGFGVWGGKYPEQSVQNALSTILPEGEFPVLLSQAKPALTVISMDVHPTVKARFFRTREAQQKNIRIVSWQRWRERQELLPPISPPWQ